MSRTIKIDNDRLYEELKSWKEQFKDDYRPVIPEYIGFAIMKIADGLSNRWNFSGYTDTWKELMVGDGVELSIKYLHNFDVDKYKNPHAYITMICYHAFQQRIKKERRENATKYNYFASAVFDASNEEHAALVDEGFYQDMLNKIDDYEQTIKKPVKKEKIEDSAPVGLDIIYDQN
ncbi:MAG: hypothetical protein [Caudoviricetes sp.]|nr:MAG: hypothetical protein [Caudoviricetes sp.]